MTVDIFPSPYHLGRPEILRKIIHRGGHGIGLVSGMAASGVTITLMALANNARENNLNTIHLRINGEQAFPDVDSVSISSINDDAINYVLKECKPDLLVIDNMDDPRIPEIAYDASLLGSFVLLGLHASSSEQAMSRFESFVLQNKSPGSVGIPPRDMIRFSVNQKFVPARNDDVSVQTRLLANYSIEFAQLMIEEANPDRVYSMLRKDVDIDYSLYVQ